MAVCAAALIAPAPAGAASFTNPTPIAVATPTTSTIQVSGAGEIGDLNASLIGFTHPYPADADILLQGPAGQSVYLMSDAPNLEDGCNTPVTGLSLNFDDAAPGPIPASSTLVSGTYKPTNNTGAEDAPCSPFLDPAPATATALSVFNGTNPNGAWTLLVSDDLSGDEDGTITGGWKLDITPSNDFDLAKVKKNKNKGTALITVDVPGPGSLTLGGAGVKTQRTGGATISKAVTEAGKVTLKVKAKGAKKAKLQDRGKVKVRAKITYTPTGGAASTETKKIKLIDN